MEKSWITILSNAILCLGPFLSDFDILSTIWYFETDLCPSSAGV
jgi:hypothetical protein